MKFGCAFFTDASDRLVESVPGSAVFNYIMPRLVTINVTAHCHCWRDMSNMFILLRS